MSAPLLDEKILAIEEAFSRSGIPHAFGGALALAYYATPRGTQDIDVNVFVETDAADAVLGVLTDLGVDAAAESELARLRNEGQMRLLWEHTPIDLFFSYDPLHVSCMRRAKTVPFGDDERIEILSAEDLLIFKVIFDRPKDWDDLAEVVYALGGELDAAYALDWLTRILPADDARLDRLREALGLRQA